MNNEEYIFNYDEVKRRFESVPVEMSDNQKLKSMLYKTHFQPRTKSKIVQRDACASNHPSMTHRSPSQESLVLPSVNFQVHVIHVQQLMPTEQFILHIHQGLYTIAYESQ